MSPEERIAWLEAELGRERARADGLQEIVHALTVKSRSSNAERQARFRARRSVTSAVTSNVTVTPNGFPPPLEGSPPPSDPSSPSPISSPPSLSAPSSPPRNELRLSVQEAPRRAKAKKLPPEKPPDPRHAPLVRALVEELGFPWDRTASGLMASSVQALLARADERPETAGEKAVAEVVRRGRIALSQAGYYSARSLPEFRKAWDRLAEPERRGGGPAPPSTWDLSKELPPPPDDDEVPL